MQPETNTYLAGTDKVTVVVQVSGFDLVDGTGRPNAPGHGHIIYSIHEDSPGSPLVSKPEESVTSTATTHTWTGLIESSYTLSAELVNNDGTPLAPPAVAVSKINVFGG